MTEKSLSEKIKDRVLEVLHGHESATVPEEGTDEHNDLSATLTGAVSETIAQHRQDQDNTEQPLSPKDAPAPGGIVNA